MHHVEHTRLGLAPRDGQLPGPKLHGTLSAGEPPVAPTSLSAKAASFGPEIELLGATARVLVQQVGAVDAGRLGDLVGRHSRTAMGHRRSPHHGSMDFDSYST